MLQEKPIFSIVIPTLNEETYLPRLLEDLAKQTFHSFEVIIVDAESEDETQKKAKNFKKKFQKFRFLTTTKRNVSYQKNTGGLAAEGQYIIFMDADNQIPQNFLQKLEEKIKDPKPDIFTCWSKADSKHTSEISIAALFNFILEASKLIQKPQGFGACIGCQREKFRSCGGFNPKISFAEDVDFIARCYKKKFRYHIFREPQYIVSLRRFRTNGKIKVFHQYIKLHLKRIFGKKIESQEYQMGGNIFKNDQILETLKNDPQLLKKLKKILKAIHHLQLP